MRRTIEFSSSFFIFLAVLLLVLPFPLALSFLAASIIHELGHTAAIISMKIPIHTVTLTYTGAQIVTAPMSPNQELLAACGGPLAGICLTFLFPFLPFVALFAAGQTVFNLLPVMPFDGGRIIRILAQKYLGARQPILCRFAEIVTYGLLMLFALILAGIKLWLSVPVLLLTLRLISQKSFIS